MVLPACEVSFLSKEEKAMTSRLSQGQHLLTQRDPEVLLPDKRVFRL